jgi:UPF0755 protein
MMKTLRNIFLWFCLAIALAAAGIAASAWYWATQPVDMSLERADYVVESGSRPRAIAQLMNEAGIRMNQDFFVVMARLSGRDKLLKAGGYEAVRGDSPWLLMERMANGDMTQTRITLVEGWNYQRVRQVLRENPQVRQTLEGVSDADLLKKLGAEQ